MTAFTPGAERAGEWTVEGVAQCPGDCGLYFDVEATLPELAKFIEAHNCAKSEKDARYTP